METVLLDELHEAPGNPRVHDDRNLAVIRSSLEQFGQVEPLVVRTNGEVIGGNGRLQVMRDIGWQSCRVVRLELTDAEASALSLVLNRSTDLSSFDDRALAPILQQLGDSGVDLDDLGWSADDLVEIMTCEVDTSAALDDEPPEMGSPYRVTTEQRAVIDRALDRIRVREHDPRMPDGRALELMAADFLSDPNYGDG